MQRLSRVLAFLLVGLVFPGSAGARSHKRRSGSSSEFSYYLLVLSYAPDFCDEPGGTKDPRECGSGRGLGFVVHGLWPQSEASRGPERCAPASPVARAIIQATLNYIPTESLIQHEWAAHGTCSGLGAADYFAALRKARNSIQIPADLNQPSRKIRVSPDRIEAEFASANPGLPKSAVRVSCYRDGELQEVRVCFNKDLSPRACGGSAGVCGAAAVAVLPVR